MNIELSSHRHRLPPPSPKRITGLILSTIANTDVDFNPRTDRDIAVTRITGAIAVARPPAVRVDDAGRIRR